MKVTSALIFFLSFYLTSFGQLTQPNSSEIYLHLQKAQVFGSVLYVAAHPDDENTRLLSWLAKEKKVRTAYLSITRGDGGQNLIGTEQGELLGIIRTQELLSARKIDGAEQFFTRANDFGYSKKPEETLQIWGKEAVLADVVWAIRKFKPDVIITRFPTTGEGGHGHHTASAILAEEAFVAAADKNRFKEQLQYVGIWQAKRLVWNTFNFGGNNTINQSNLIQEIGEYNALLGKGYGEIAAESRSQHKSQGFGVALQRGYAAEFFKHRLGDSASTDLFERINITANRLKGTENYQQIIQNIILQYDFKNPSASLQLLAEAYKATEEFSDAYWKTEKQNEIKNLMRWAAGLWFEVTATDPVMVPGEKAAITIRMVHRNNSPTVIRKISIPNLIDTTLNELLKTNEFQVSNKSITLPITTNYTNPYWLHQRGSLGMYKVDDQQKIGKPENEAALLSTFQFEIAGMPLDFTVPITYKWVDPVEGERYRPIEILPPATINIADKVLVFANKDASKEVKVTVKAWKNQVNGSLKLSAGKNWNISPAFHNIDLKNKNDEITVTFLLSSTSNTPSEEILNAVLELDGKNYDQSLQRIDYKHIPMQIWSRKASAKLVRENIEIRGKIIGYIIGAGDEIPQSLQQIGYQVSFLTDEELTNQSIEKYDAIVIGIRAYNTNSRMPLYYQKLMKFVENGGNLILQFNTNNNLGRLNEQIGPYPFTISRDRVTVEEAPVTFNLPEHPSLNTPNKITLKDFDGWIQERGVYFARDIDKNYQTPLAMNDPNEAATNGSLLIAKYGKGHFVYTGLAFFRQLPAGNPGALRFFANLVSLGK